MESRQNRGANEQWLFHGTSVDAVASINENGFDRSFTTEGVAYELGQHDLLDFEEGETSYVGDDYPKFDRLVDAGPQIEVGLAIDFHPHVGLFLRVPVFFGVNPDRAVATDDGPPALLNMSTAPRSPPFGLVRFMVGVQGRAFGLPLQPKKRVLE